VIELSANAEIEFDLKGLFSKFTASSASMPVPARHERAMEFVVLGDGRTSGAAVRCSEPTNRNRSRLTLASEQTHVANDRGGGGGGRGAVPRRTGLNRRFSTQANEENKKGRRLSLPFERPICRARLGTPAPQEGNRA